MRHRDIVTFTAALLLTPLCALAEPGCGLDARNTFNVALPAIAPGEMPAPLATDIDRAFHLLLIDYRTPEAALLLHSIDTRAAAQNIRCAEALAEFGLGRVARTTKLSEALPHYLRAEDLLKTIGTPLALAYVHLAIASTHSALTDNTPSATQQILKELRDAGDPAAAIQLQSAAAVAIGNGTFNPDDVAALANELESIHTPNVTGVRGYVQWAWGSAMRRSGRYGEILTHFQQAIADLTTCNCEPETRAAVLLNLAAAMDSVGDADSVLRYATQGDAIYRQFHFDALRPQSMRLIAAAYAHRGDFAQAITELEAAMQLARDQHAFATIPFIAVELAAAYGDAGQPQKGLQLLVDTAPPKPTLPQTCAYTAQRMGLETQAALDAPAQADGEKVFGDCAKFLSPPQLGLLHAQYATLQLRTGHTEDALTHARSAVTITDARRPRVEQTDRALLTFNNQQSSAYTLLIRALLQSNKPEEALLASEQFRARSFIDLATTRDTTPAPQTANTAQPSFLGAPKGPPALRSEVHPFTLTAADIRGHLDKQHSTLVSYWVANDRLYTWVLAPGKPAIEKDQPISPVELAALVRATLPGEASTLTRRGGPGSPVGAAPAQKVRTRGGQSQTVSAGNHKPWQQLYQLLIAPIADQLPTGPDALLTIVPQGPLFELSFPALLDPQNHYLIESFAIHTAPSAGVLDITSRNEAASASLPSRYIVLANPERFPQVNGASLPPLPGTQAEARNIALKLSGKSVTLLEGRRAGIDTLTTTLPDATVLHLATHAIVSDSAPATSFLALDSRQRGGKLTTTSVYKLHLHANLVVLSACSTGRGQISGDGVAGLSRAFFYAGAASLVTTLWDVVDEPTAKLMPRFYSSLAAGETRSAALRSAQLSLIDDLRHHRVRVETLSGKSIPLPENPAYWAAFSLSGQP